MKDIAKKVHKYEKQIAGMKEERAKLEGKKEAALAQLNEAGFETIEAAEKFIEDQMEELSQREDALRADMDEFEELYAQYLED